MRDGVIGQNLDGFCPCSMYGFIFRTCDREKFMAGASQWVCIGFGLAAASVLVWLTFSLNTQYGEFGLMKLFARQQHPRYLLNRKAPSRLFRSTRKGGQP